MPNRAVALEWETPDDAPLRRQLIDAALATADEDGLEGVTIRRVAARVGRRPMTVYAHVPSKQGLIALMFDRVSAGLLVPEPIPTSGREVLKAISTRAFETYLAHPWMLVAFGHRPPPGPNQLLRAEQAAAAVGALGVAKQDAWRVVSMVHDWTMGHALHVLTLRQDKQLASALDAVDRDAYPATAGALEGAANTSAGDAFEVARDALLDGIEARFGTG